MFRKYHLFGFVLTIILGSIFHFVYDWSGKAAAAGAFFAVNESTWEHLKLIFLPMLLLSIIGYFVYGKNFSGFMLTRLLSLLLGIFVIVSAFYTYTGIAGFHWLIPDILCFVLGSAAAWGLSFFLLKKEVFAFKGADVIGWAGMLLLFALFVLFTYFPPHIALFRDPNVFQYGILENFN